MLDLEKYTLIWFDWFRTIDTLGPNSKMKLVFKD
jgi:hypothetical protein